MESSTRQRTLAVGLSLAAMLVLGMLLARPAHAATFTVNSTGDDGDRTPDGVCDSNANVTVVTCTLREAIQEANASTTTDDTIDFAIPASDCNGTTGVCTIFPGSVLPAITDKVTINGYSQAGANVNTGAGNNNADLKIELNGRGAGAFAHGLFFTGSGAVGTRVRGLVINSFDGNGVVVAAGAASVDGNFIGTDPTGTIDRGNGGDGVRVTASGNLIGGSPDASQNVISGNAGNGVSVRGSAGTSNTVSNNRIGTDADAQEDLGNSESGVFVSAPGVLVGGVEGDGTAGARNVITGNDEHGVEIEGAGADGTEVLGNTIGLGNGFSGIGNTLDGVLVDGAPRVEVGGTGDGEGNTISDNDLHGVEIVGSSSTGTRVLGNRIGTDPTGSAAFGNAFNGVRIRDASNNAVGDSTDGASNLISGNGSDGVVILGLDASNNRIEGNRIGTGVNGRFVLRNGDAGVNITDGSGNFVGGPEVGASNLISGNTGRGVLIAGDATNNRVQSNFIGTDVFGSGDLGNDDAGVEIFEGSNNVIGGTASRTGNIISGNDTDGVELGLGATGNRVEGNLIGTGQNGASDLGNGEVGVLVRGSDNTVGGTVSGARNVVSGNGGVGVTMLGTGASGNTVRGNLIGTQVDGTTPLSNFHGVFVSDAANNTIGGSVSAAANTISGNTNHGVMVVGDSAIGNRILRNSIFNNGTPGGLGIELNNDGVTFNDRKDPDAGPNKLQNFPVITSVSTTRIEGKLNSRPGKRFTIQFFSNPQPNFPTGFGEGQTFLGQKTVRTNDRGNVSFAFTTTVSADQVITATATDSVGNTSEFSQSHTVE